MNNSISPRVTALHPADLESGDSGAIESTIKHCMDAKARFSPKMAFGPRTIKPGRRKGRPGTGGRGRKGKSYNAVPFRPVLLEGISPCVGDIWARSNVTAYYLIGGED